MKLAKVLSIKGALLDKYQLGSYLEKIASDHVLQENSDEATYPIPRLKENFKFITETYEILNEHLKKGINIHPAGEWLLDNYYIIEESVKTIEKELTLKKYKSLIGIGSQPYKGFARIFVLATEIISYTEARIDSHSLEDFLKAYQTKKTLNMEEIWSIGIFLQIAIIENIRNICEKIYSSQIQKYKVEDIIERLVEYKTPHNQKFNIKLNYKTKIIESSQMKYPFIEYMSYRLKRYGKKAYSYLEILEEQVSKTGTTVSDIIRKEHFDIAVKKVAIGNCIKSIKEIGRINFLEIFENINGVEELLKQDPAKVYEKMDYKTKAYYRNKIKEIAKRTKISELYITKKALELAKSYENTVENSSEKQSHIGYYLISNGIKDLYKTLQTNKKPHKNKSSVKLYIFSIVLLSTVIAIVLSYYIAKQQNIILGVILFILAYIPVTQIATYIIQYILNKSVKPRLIPKMDYINGVPKEDATMVIIPSIVKSPQKVKDLISKLEVFYLANKSENIYFTLLGDATVSSKEKEEIDEEIINAGRTQVKKLNEKYPNERNG